MVTEMIISVLGLLGVSNIITFFLTRKKYNSEVDSQVVQNVRDAFEAYKKVMGDTLELQNRKIKELQDENNYLKGQFRLMQEQLTHLLVNEKATAAVRKNKPSTKTDHDE